MSDEPSPLEEWTTFNTEHWLVREMRDLQDETLELISFTTIIKLSPPLCRNVEHVVAPDEGVPVLVLQLTVAVLLGLLQGDVHVAVQAGEDAPVVHPGVELHHNWAADDLLQEIVGILPLRTHGVLRY